VSYALICGLQGSNQVGEKSLRAVIGLVEVEPGGLQGPNTWSLAAYPLGEQGRLAVAGRCGHDGEFAAQAKAIVQPLDQAGAGHKVGTQRWDVQLGGQERYAPGRPRGEQRLGHGVPNHPIPG
jgi:hypothetical protein